jgi:hypothetical protein
MSWIILQARSVIRQWEVKPESGKEIEPIPKKVLVKPKKQKSKPEKADH